MSEAVERVSANYRYIGAYNELNARIAQRKQALAFYGAICMGLIGATLGGVGRYDAPTLMALLLVLPAATAALALINIRSERLMANLRTYLAELERLGDTTIPAYNADPRWLASVQSHRHYYDFASGSIAAAAGICLLVLASRSPLQQLELVGAGVLIAASALALVSLPARAARIGAVGE